MKRLFLLYLLAFSQFGFASATTDLKRRPGDLILRSVQVSEPYLRQDGLHGMEVTLWVSNRGPAIRRPFRVGIAQNLTGINRGEAGQWFFPSEIKVRGIKANSTQKFEIEMATRTSWIEHGIDILAKVDSCFHDEGSAFYCQIRELRERNNTRILRNITLND